MLSIALALVIGFLLHLVGLDTLFHNLMGFTSHQYYLTWLVLGFILWIARISTKVVNKK